MNRTTQKQKRRGVLHHSIHRLWDVVTGQQIRVLEGHTSQIRSVAWCLVDWTENREFVLSNSSADGTVKFWDIKTGDRIPFQRA